LQELAWSGSQTPMLIKEVQIHIWEIDWPERPWMKGLQRPLTWAGDWLDDGSLDWYWKSCDQFGIPVMALVPGMQC